MIVSLAILGVLILGVGVSGYAIHKVNTRMDRWADGFAAFFTAESEGQTSAFGELIAEIGKVTGQSSGQAVLAALRGSTGGAMRHATAEMEAEAMAQDPSLAVMSVLPKSLTKNPLLAVGLQNLIAKALASSGGGGNNYPRSDGAGQVKFNFKV